MGMPVSQTATPRNLASGLVSGVATQEIALNGDLTTATDQPIIGLRVVVNAGDDVAAAQSLATGIGCTFLTPDSVATLNLQAGATAVYVLGIGSAATPADYAGGACVQSVNDTSTTAALANLRRFDFSSLDVVKTLRVGLTATWASGLSARAFVEGYSHA